MAPAPAAAAAVVLLSSATPSPASADALFEPRLLADDTYSEGWEQLFRFADGTLLSAHFMITNLGPGSHRGIVIATLTLPDGTRYLVKNGRPRRAWQPLSGPGRLGIAGHRLLRRGGGYHLVLRNSVAEVELDYRPTVPAWDLGRTWVDKEAGRYLDRVYYAPALEARGRFRPGPARGGGAGSPWRPLAQGRGWALRYVNSTGAHRLLRRRLRLTSLGGHLRVMAGEFWVTADGTRRGRLARWRGGRLLADRPVRAFQRRPGQPDRPLAALVLAGGGLDGHLGGVRLLEEFDVLAHMDLLERLLIGAYSRPVERRYLARLRLDPRGEPSWSGQVLVEEVEIHPQEGDDELALQYPSFGQIVVDGGA